MAKKENKNSYQAKLWIELSYNKTALLETNKSTK